MIKLAVFDIDGTLREKDYIPESTIKALEKIKSKDIELAICTGRSEYDLTSLREKLDIDWTISSNGGQVAYRGKPIIGTSFSKDIVNKWLDYAEQMGHEMLLYGAEKMYINRSDAPTFKKVQKDYAFRDPVLMDESISMEEVYQVVVFCEEFEEESYLSMVNKRPYIYRWGKQMVDFNPHGMNKAVGLQELLNILKVTPQETVAFGDGLNDIEMMELVGTAIVMGNGMEELKKKATFVTKSLRDKGIDFAVRHLEDNRLI